LHGTAGFTRASDVAAFFANPATQASTHYVVDIDGAIYQCVQESDAAWANGPITGPSGVAGDGIHHDSFWDTGVNPNLVSIAIEHLKPHIDNSDQLTNAQKAASFKLIQHICQRWQIPMRPANTSGGITGHYSMDPVNRSRCPGPYPWSDLWAFLGGKTIMLPNGWQDDGVTLKCNGFVVVKGFRDYVLQRLLDGTWRGDDVPVENEQSVKVLEYSNPGLGSGSRQRFKYSTLEYTQDRGVFQAYTGPELIKLEQLLILANAQIQQLQKQQPTPAPTPPLPANLAQAVQAINAIGVMAEQLKSDGDTISSAVKNALVALGK